MSRIDPETREFLDSLIYKHDLRAFFVKLREQAHHIYALLAGVPKTVFWIAAEDADDNREKISIREFYARLGEFHRSKYRFDVYFNAYFFREEWDTCCPCWELGDNEFNGKDFFECTKKEELSVADFEDEFPHLLAFWCRESILANRPFTLTRSTIQQFGFTRKDVPVLRDLVNCCNERIIAELRAKYDALAAIDCLHQPVPRRRKRQPKGTTR